MSRRKETASKERQNLWKAMRALSVFTKEDLMITTGASLTSVNSFIRVLMKAGYLRVEGKVGEGLKAVNRYRLIKNTGSKTPIERRIVVLYDPNTSQGYEVSDVD